MDAATVLLLLQEVGVPASREPSLPWQRLVAKLDTVQAVP